MIEKLKMILPALRVIVGLIRAVDTLVNKAENMDTEGGHGDSKKNFVMKAVELIYDLLDDIVGLDDVIEKEKLLDKVDRLVEILVEFYNTVGWFRKKIAEFGFFED